MKKEKIKDIGCFTAIIIFLLITSIGIPVFLVHLNKIYGL